MSISLSIPFLAKLKQIPFSELAKLPFSRLHETIIQQDVTTNCLKVSMWGTLGCGGTALVSFIFNRFLSQERAWKALVPHIFKASLFSCGTFAAFAAYIVYQVVFVCKNKDDLVHNKTTHDNVSLIVKRVALVGLIGATAAFAFRFVTSSSLISSLADYSLSPLLGVGTAGLTLTIFRNRQTTHQCDLI